MPCTYDPPGYSGAVPAVSKSEMDLVTRVACKMIKALEELTLDYACPSGVYDVNDAVKWLRRLDHIDDEVKTWIENHLKADAERRVRLRENALAKLTAEEKEALGL